MALKKRMAAAVLLAVVGCAADGVLAVDPAAEVELQRKLDAPFDLSLERVELQEAFKAIAAKSKVPLQVDPLSYDLLPFGATTRVSATFRQSKLRDAIEEVLLPLGLEQHVSGSALMIRPSKALARTGRRAEWKELELLRLIRATELPGGGADLDVINTTRAALERQDVTVTIEKGEGQAHAAAVEQLKKQMPMSVSRMLDAYSQATNQVWFVEHNTVRIMTMRTWIKRQLDRPIQLQLKSAPLDQVVAELSHLSGIRFVPEPGLYTTISTVSVSSSGGSVIGTLEALSGATGLAFEIREDSVLLHMANRSPNAPARPDAIVGRISVPVKNGDGAAVSMDVFVRESDLPAEMNELRKRRIQEAIESLQREWTAPVPPPPPPPPATQGNIAPATAPAEPATQPK